MDASTPSAPPSALASASAQAPDATVSISDAPVDSFLDASALATDAGKFVTRDGGDRCGTVSGLPARQKIGGRGPVSLHLSQPLHQAAKTVRILANVDGRPHWLDPPFENSPAFLHPRCVADRLYVYCADKSGDIRRYPASGQGAGKVVANSRAGTSISAFSVGDTHSALGYLASRKTSEGFVTEAWLLVDDAPPARLSEDGAGATSIELAPRGSELLALMLDRRSALTAVHARSIAWGAGKAVFGSDAVVFVAGPSERHTAAHLAVQTDDTAHVLMPIAKSASQFAMAAIRVGREPKEDSPVTWSDYPNGIDPAPLATARFHDTSFVLRTRPASSDPASANVVELGTLSTQSVFEPLTILSPQGKVTDVALAADSAGTLWIAYADASGHWLEHRRCDLRAHDLR